MRQFTPFNERAKACQCRLAEEESAPSGQVVHLGELVLWPGGPANDGIREVVPREGDVVLRHAPFPALAPRAPHPPSLRNRCRERSGCSSDRWCSRIAGKARYHSLNKSMASANSRNRPAPSSCRLLIPQALPAAVSASGNPEKSMQKSMPIICQRQSSKARQNPRHLGLRLWTEGPENDPHAVVAAVLARARVISPSARRTLRTHESTGPVPKEEVPGHGTGCHLRRLVLVWNGCRLTHKATSLTHTHTHTWCQTMALTQLASRSPQQPSRALVTTCLSWCLFSKRRIPR